MTKTKKVYYQIGMTNVLRDIKRKAKVPGKRISAVGNKYYEYRRNRSDMPKTKL